MAGETSDNELSQIQMQASTKNLERLMKQQSDGLHENIVAPSSIQVFRCYYF